MEWVGVLWAVLAILVLGGLKYAWDFNTMQLPERVRQRIKEMPPGTMGWPLIGETFRFKQALNSSNPFVFYEKRIVKWGDIFMTHFAGSPMLSTVSPEAAKEILSQEHSLFVTRYPPYTKKLMGEFSLIELHGDTHKRMRRLQQPFLQPEKLKSFMGTVDRIIINNLEEYQKKGTFPARDLCKQTTFDVITKLMMDVDRGPESDAILKDFDYWRMALRRLPIQIPGSAFSKGVQARVRMGAVIEDICKKRQQEGTVGRHSDLIDTLLTEHESEGGPPLTFQQVNDLVFTVLAAGMDTSSTVLSFAMMYLLESPDVLDKLRKENLDLRARVGADQLLSWSDLKSLDYTTKVINEVLRLTSPAPAVYREALKDTKLLGFFIPSNLRMQISITAIHRDPRNYKDPAKFDPDRWQVKVSSWHVAFAFALESIIHSRFLHSGQEESYKYLFPSCCRFLTGRKTSRKGTDLLSVWVRPPDMHRNGAGSVGDCVVPSSSCLQIHMGNIRACDANLFPSSRAHQRVPCSTQSPRYKLTMVKTPVCITIVSPLLLSSLRPATKRKKVTKKVTCVKDTCTIYIT